MNLVPFSRFAADLATQQLPNCSFIAPKDLLVEQYSVNPGKVTVVENGVETDLFTPDGIKAALGAQEKFVVAYIGTIGMAHGVETVIQAALELRTKLPDAIFLVVGEGAGRERSLAAIPSAFILR
jgi:glycosyltransferase involved in cell wall biosynthesis